MTTTMTRVSDLTPGDLVDLEGDPYADPNGDGTCDCSPGCNHYTAFEFELCVVESLRPESSTVIAVEFIDVGLFAFPPGHTVPVIEEP